MSSKPRALRASLYDFQLFVRYLRGAGFIRSDYQTCGLYAGPA